MKFLIVKGNLFCEHNPIAFMYPRIFINFSSSLAMLTNHNDPDNFCLNEDAKKKSGIANASWDISNDPASGCEKNTPTPKDWIRNLGESHGF